jgi:serine/threonine-protein kinase HipA
MATTTKIYVYADWVGLKQATLMGELTATYVRGTEVFSFEYTADWIQSGQSQDLDPSLQFYLGPQFNNAAYKPNFGIFLDSSPDRWGRLLMKRREAILARKEYRKPRVLVESDFLLGVYDEYRVGGLRFKTDLETAFLSAEKWLASLPWTNLRELEQASLALEKEDMGDDETLKWLNMLMAPGSSLGGARPKASVKDPNENLWIAKFPSGKDEHDVGAWEKVALQIASDAGISVYPTMVRKFSGKHHTFLSKRFDRTDSGDRIHFASAMTLLGYNDGTDHHDGVSYIELAEHLIQHGSNVNEDLKELWKRIVLNICIKNTDDHLRNHGFLLTDSGWRLSPLYDVNPFPEGMGLTLNISEDDNSLNLNLALSVSGYFRLKEQEAKKIIEQIKVSVLKWRKFADELKISRAEQSRMSGAFSD